MSTRAVPVVPAPAATTDLSRGLLAAAVAVTAWGASSVIAKVLPQGVSERQLFKIIDDKRVVWVPELRNYVHEVEPYREKQKHETEDNYRFRCQREENYLSEVFNEFYPTEPPLSPLHHSPYVPVYLPVSPERDPAFESTFK